LEALLDNGYGFLETLEINAATGNGISVLDRAAKGGFAKHVALLLARGADGNFQRNDNGHTALLSAAAAAYGECCTTLLKHGADVNASGHDGCTGLHLAADPVTLLGNSAAGAKAAVIKALLLHRADPSLRNNNGQTALDIAFSKGFAEATHLLLGVRRHEPDFQLLVTNF